MISRLSTAALLLLSSFQFVSVSASSGSWHTAVQPNGRWAFVDPTGTPRQLKGISFTGLETGTIASASGAGYWLFQPSSGPSSQAETVVQNVLSTLITDWNTDIVRVPICASAWAQNYVVHDWSNVPVTTYKNWVDIAVQQIRKLGKVAIIDSHLWAIAQSTGANGLLDGCNSGGSCAPTDFAISVNNVWECPISNANGVTLQSAAKNLGNLQSVWADIAMTYAGDSGVWYELFNEPYEQSASGANIDESNYDWAGWASVFNSLITTVRQHANNIVIVGGLDFSGDFGPVYGPIGHPTQYLPWVTAGVANVAYNFHPYQHGACCGQIGSNTDLSVSDPYESGWCLYGNGQASQSMTPSGQACSSSGYAATSDKKVMPCQWSAISKGPNGQTGVCLGERAICGTLNQAQCNAVNAASPSAGSMSRYFLPMNQYGPLIATEFGTFDCSSPYVTSLLSYFETFGISYTAWALWPQNSGGPGQGSCGYPSTAAATPTGDWSACTSTSACSSLMKPLPFAGLAVYNDLQKARSSPAMAPSFASGQSPVNNPGTTPVVPNPTPAPAPTPVVPTPVQPPYVPVPVVPTPTPTPTPPTPAPKPAPAPTPVPAPTPSGPSANTNIRSTTSSCWQSGSNEYTVQFEFAGLTAQQPGSHNSFVIQVLYNGSPASFTISSFFNAASLTVGSNGQISASQVDWTDNMGGFLVFNNGVTCSSTSSLSFKVVSYTASGGSTTASVDDASEDDSIFMAEPAETPATPTPSPAPSAHKPSTPRHHKSHAAPAAPAPTRPSHKHHRKSANSEVELEQRIEFELEKLVEKLERKVEAMEEAEDQE